MNKSFTTKQLVERLYENLNTLAPKGAEKAYIAGFISSCLGDIAEKGVDELAFIVDYTNQRIEVNEYNERADARRQAWVDSEFGVAA